MSGGCPETGVCAHPPGSVRTSSHKELRLQAPTRGVAFIMFCFSGSFFSLLVCPLGHFATLQHPCQLLTSVAQDTRVTGPPSSGGVLLSWPPFSLSYSSTPAMESSRLLLPGVWVSTKAPFSDFLPSLPSPGCPCQVSSLDPDGEAF